MASVTLLRAAALAATISCLLASPTFHDLQALDIDGKPFDFSATSGKVVVVANVASQVCVHAWWTFVHCLTGLFWCFAQEFGEVLRHYNGRVQVMAFPCNQFGHQEPGSDAEIKKFAYGHGFTGFLMDKVDVNGPSTHPVYSWLKEQSGDTSDISWNFAKFLVRPDGTVAGRYPPHTSPNALRPFIEQILGDALAPADERRLGTCRGCWIGHGYPKQSSLGGLAAGTTLCKGRPSRLSLAFWAMAAADRWTR
eukprot:jgi/Tetstr1/423390/TSEL_014076.t1